MNNDFWTHLAAQARDGGLTEFQQQQWQQRFAQNPFAQMPLRLSAVAAEAYQGPVIEGVSRRVPTTECKTS